MRHTFIILFFLFGVVGGLLAQDKIVRRNGVTIEVKVQRTDATHVHYTYPGETTVYLRPKTDISYILYQDGRRETFNESQRVPERTAAPPTSTANRNRLLADDEIFWQDVKTTFQESDVRGMRRLNRVSAVSSISYKDAIQELKKKAADVGGTTVLLMDLPEIDFGNDIEVMGIAYRDENLDYVPRSTAERNRMPEESDANARRRRIAQQMESYNNESNLDYRNTTPPRNTNQSNARQNQPASRQQQSNNANANTPDAVYLINGRVVRGTIQEFEPDDFVSIRNTAGRIYEYSMDDVRRVDYQSARNTRTSTARTQPSRNQGYADDGYGRNNRSSSRYNDNYYDDSYVKIGYKGTFDAGYDMALGKTGGKGAFEFNTSHGYQVNEYLFAGAGLGLHIYNALDSAMKNAANYPHYAGRAVNGKMVLNPDTIYMRAVDSSYMTLPIFLDIRGYLPLQNSKITPFVMFRFGYAFNLSDGFKGMGIYMNPALGVKYQVSPMIGINFSVGYSFQSYGGIPKNGGYGYHYISDSNNTKREANGAGGLSLKLGVEF